MPGVAQAQRIAYRGFFETGVTLYPQTAPNDSTQGVTEARVRFDPSVALNRQFSIAASFEGRLASHDQIAWRVDFSDRSLRRPAFAVRTLALTFARGPVTLEIGKQFVRWGQSDILSPTDQFTPRDYLTPVANEALAPTAVRATVASLSRSLELVYVPRMTPSRMPLLDQRWIGLQAVAAGLPLVPGRNAIPRKPQWGARWHEIGSRLEYSVTFFQGNHHLPLLDAALAPSGTALRVNRRYPEIRAWGGDAVIPTSRVTVRAEAAWRDSLDDDTDEYGLWVLQLERQQGPWLLLGGLVEEWVTADRGAFGFAPDRGVARSIVARASYSSGTNDTFVLEAVARRNGDGLYLKTEYSRGLGSHWRTTLQLLLIRGDASDFFGQYRRNSWSLTRARFNF